MEREQDNLRAALQWAIEQHDGELAQRMAGALQPFWFKRGYWSEGRRWLEEVVAMHPGAGPDPAVRAKALYSAGMLARFQGDFARARMLCVQSLELYRTLADQAGVVMALVQLGRICSFQDDQTAAQAFMAEAASLMDALPDSVVKADAYTNMVLVMVDSGTNQTPPEVDHYLAESERIHRAFNNPSGLAFTLLHQANLALFDGDDARTAARFDEAERLAKELGDDHIFSRMALARISVRPAGRRYRQRAPSRGRQACSRSSSEVTTIWPPHWPCWPSFCRSKAWPAGRRGCLAWQMPGPGTPRR